MISRGSISYSACCGNGAWLCCFSLRLSALFFIFYCPRLLLFLTVIVTDDVIDEAPDKSESSSPAWWNTLSPCHSVQQEELLSFLIS